MFNDVCCHILVAEDCVVPPKHEANVPVRMLSDGTPLPPSNWAIEPHMQEPGVIAARTLLTDCHKEPAAHVCNYSKKPYNFNADIFLVLAEPVIHITGADSKAVGSSLSTHHGLNVSIQPDASTR